MVDACTIVSDSETTVPVFDEATGTYTPAAGDTVYTGRCRVGSRGVLVNQEVDAGDREQGVNRLELSLPVVGSEAVSRGDQVTITAAIYDPGLVNAGMRFVVTGPHVGTAITARRLQIAAVVIDG